MHVLTFDPERCVGCTVCEEACAEMWFKVADVAWSSIRIHDEGSGPISAIFCNQCGECIAVCPTQALQRDRRGIVRVQKKLCVGCLACVGFCPHRAMFRHPDQLEPFKCTSCGQCVKQCPAEALAITEPDTP